MLGTRSIQSYLAITPQNVSYFINADGVATLTNRPGTYRHREDHIEVSAPFKPVFVPDRFTTFGSALEYSSSAIERLAERYSRENNLDKYLVLAVIRMESAFDPYAVSKKGARGLMQLMPATAEEMGVRNIFDPAQNIAGGTQYLASLLREFRYDENLALAAYNAGPATVTKYKGIPPFKETRSYVRNVLRLREWFATGKAQVDYTPVTERPRVAYLPEAPEKHFTIHFHNGLTQPAHTVDERKNHYLVTFDGRTYYIRKSLVEKVVNPA